MADFAVQILPPLKGYIAPARKGSSQFVQDPSGLTSALMLSPQANPSVNVVRSSGLMLYDTVRTAVSGQAEGPSGEGKSAFLGTVVDIEA